MNSGANTLNPVVSVCVVTYNQIQFVRDCIDSLINQNVNFKYEIVVGDDASTDGTSAIVERFGEQYPDLVVPLLHTKNIGPIGNLVAVHKMARGKYICHVDGDDLACEDKLSKQFELMENNPDLAACGHSNWVINENGTKTGNVFPVHKQESFDKADVILLGMPFLHSTLMYRRKFMVLDNPDREYFDWYIIAALSDCGSLGFISEKLGYYRLNSQGLTSVLNRSLMKDRMLEMYCLHAKEWRDMKPQFSAVALLELLADVKNRRPVGYWNKQLLKHTFTLRSLPFLIWTYRRRKANARVLYKG